MCGIAGILTGGRPVSKAEVKQMCDTIVHRGPDDEGFYAAGTVGLGMRRLSIIDLSGGRQPVHNEDQNVWVVFNGEIYNFLDLRAELEAQGHRFYTHSDTETIVHAYEEFGDDFVKKLRGMFAIALYDVRRKRLVLARDRMGKKPLFYAQSDGELLFGSEIKTIAAVAPQLLDATDTRAMLSYFRFGYVQDPATPFLNIKKLPPATLMVYENGEAKLHRYWQLPEFGTQNPTSEAECLERVEHELAEAVKLRLISDVPLGAFLSGGVDSSIVVGLMARASSKPVRTFSIGFKSQDFDESPYARAVAQKFGTVHEELVVEADLWTSLEKLSRNMEEPFADSSLLPTYLVCELTRRHVTVALSGDGGDELFGGYNRYRQHLQRRRLPLASVFGRQYRRHIYPLLARGARGRRYLYNASLASRDRYIDSMSCLPAEREAEIFSREFLASAAAVRDPQEDLRELWDNAPAKDDLGRLIYVDMNSYLPGDILTKVDRASMLASLETRAPLLDHNVAEMAATLDSSWKVRDSEQKYILRKLALRLGVPAEAVHRRKQGFGIPLVHWLRNELRGDFTRILLEPATIQRGYFSKEGITAMLAEHDSGRRDRSHELWMLLMFELWHRNFLAQVNSQAEEGCSVPAITEPPRGTFVQ